METSNLVYSFILKSVIQLKSYKTHKRILITLNRYKPNVHI